MLEQTATTRVTRRPANSPYIRGMRSSVRHSSLGRWKRRKLNRRSFAGVRQHVCRNRVPRGNDEVEVVVARNQSKGDARSQGASHDGPVTPVLPQLQPTHRLRAIAATQTAFAFFGSIFTGSSSCFSATFAGQSERLNLDAVKCGHVRIQRPCRGYIVGRSIHEQRAVRQRSWLPGPALPRDRSRHST